MEFGFEREKNRKTCPQVTSCTCSVRNGEKVHEKTGFDHNLIKILSILDEKNSVNTDFSRASSLEFFKAQK